MRRFELSEGTSHKFWEIGVEGPSTTVRFGRLGTDGQVQAKDHGSPDKARAAAEKLVAEKTKKGYAEASAPTSETAKAPTVISAAAGGPAPVGPIPHEAPPVGICTPSGSSRELVLGFAVDGRRAVAVGGQGSNLLLTTEDGAVWKKGLSRGHGLRAAWLTDEALWVVGEYGYISCSANFGKTWKAAQTKFKSCLFGVVQDPTGTLWVSGNDSSIYLSKEGGPFRPKRFGKYTGVITSSPAGVLIPTDQPGQLFIGKSVRAKSEWEQTAFETALSVRSATMTPTGAIVVVGAKGTAARADAEKGAFAKVAVRTSADLRAVECFADGRVVIVGASGVLLISYDDGRTFEPLEQKVTTKDFWACKRYGDALLVGGSDGLILSLGELGAAQQHETPPPEQSERVREGRAGGAPQFAGESKAKDPAAPKKMPEAPARPEWAATAASTSVQAWQATTDASPDGPGERYNGLLVGPELRAWLYPRRGGLRTDIRPLPTLEEAWSHLRRVLWASDRETLEGPDRRAGFQRDKERDPSGIWALVTSENPAYRRMGERILDPKPRAATKEDDAALVSLSLVRYRQDWVKLHQDLVQEAVADFLVASVGLEEAMERALVGLDDELPYVGAGPFGRLRELLVLADAAAYAAARRRALEVGAREMAKCRPAPETRGYHDKDREVDLAAAVTFCFPLGPEAGPEERAAHERALRYVGKFGDLSVAHASGIAAGDLATFEAYRKRNKAGHEFYAPGGGKLYLASVLEVAGKEILPLLVGLKPAEPWTDSEDYNGRWCALLAHVDDDAALEVLFKEHKRGKFWGTAGLARALRLDRERVARFAKAQGEGAALLDALGKVPAPTPPDRPFLEVLRSLEDVGVPFPYTPGKAAHFAEQVSSALGLAPEMTWRDAERAAVQNAERDREGTTWDGVGLAKLGPAALEGFLRHRERWAMPTDVLDLATAPLAAHPRLRALGFAFDGWANGLLPQVMLRGGLDQLPLLVAATQHPNSNEVALAAALPFGDISLLPTMATAFAGKKNKATARSWLLRHPCHAIGGALALLSTKSRGEVERVLRYLDTKGRRELILELARSAGCEKAVVELLEMDPLAAPKVKRPVLPPYAAAGRLPALGTAKGGKASAEEIGALLTQLAFSNADEIHPGVLAAKARYAPASRAAFAWQLFQSWLDAGADPKQSFCMQAVGFLGDDESARKLAALAKAWPGQQAAARAQSALDALLNVGTDSALIQINLLAEKSRFPAFKEAARERIEAIADARGLTSEELADRLAPTLGLEEEGAAVLDYGPRQFKLGFGPDLLPTVLDGKAVLPDLPKPGKGDDAAKAQEAKARFTALKKDARTSASLQIARLERTMQSGRHIEGQVFDACFAKHPWMGHLARRLVWAAFAEDKLAATFRVAEDGTLASADDDTFRLPEGAWAGVLHPLLFPAGELAKWKKIFADYEIVQPFPQLERPVHALELAELAGKRLKRFADHKVPYAALRGLETRGWEKWIDASVQMAKRLPSGGFAVLVTDPGWHPSEQATDIGEQTIEGLELYDRKSFGELSPVERSELVHDLERLAAVR